MKMHFSQSSYGKNRTLDSVERSVLRMVMGTICIYFFNYILARYHIGISVAINPVKIRITHELLQIINRIQ